MEYCSAAPIYRREADDPIFDQLCRFVQIPVPPHLSLAFWDVKYPEAECTRNRLPSSSGCIKIKDW